MIRCFILGQSFLKVITRWIIGRVKLIVDSPIDVETWLICLRSHSSTKYKTST